MALVQVVEWDEPVTREVPVLAWKYTNPAQPERSDELGTWTQLVVRESQEAILFKNGQALDLFTPGRHTLGTANVPLLAGLIRLPFGGESPFKAEVWFVNKVSMLNVKWGTPDPIQIQDPRYKVFLPVRSFGQFGVRVADARKFLVKLVGTVRLFDQEHLNTLFRGLVLTKAKDLISSYLVKQGISVVEVNAHLDDMSGHIRERLASVVEEYGIEVPNFFVNSINIPEDDPAVAELKKALAEKARMDIVGYNYQQMRTFDTLQAAASNEGSSGTLLGAGLGLGMGVGMGGAFGGAAASMAGSLSPTGATPCPRCGALNPPGARFCLSCGALLENSVPALCSRCGGSLPRGAKFCPACGDRYDPCPTCGADLPEGASACPKCGAPRPLPCPRCGASSPPGTKFCPGCGQALIPGPLKCAACGAEMSPGAKFCPECGARRD